MTVVATALLAQVREVRTPEIDWFAVSPLLVLVGGAVLLLTVHALTVRRPTPGTYATFTMLVGLLALSAGMVVWARVVDPDRGPFTAIAEAIVVDGFAAFFTVLISAAVVLGALQLDNYLRREGLEGPEVYVLMLLSASGGVIMASANDLIVLFLGLEILSIAAYVMSGSHLRRIESQESAVKYFILGSFSSAFFLYGIALIYGATGSTNLGRIAAFLAGNVPESDALLLGGFALMLVGLAFKVAAVPFHVWIPDVYQGAPTPVTAFMASAIKAAGFAGLVRVFVVTFDEFRLDWQPVVWALAVLTMVVGAVLAIVQDDVKRMLAYSSVSHAGFVLVGVYPATDDGVAAALFYLLAYSFMVIGSFGVVTVVGRRGDIGHSITDYRGLARAQPALALAFTVFLLAQAGVPLTSGFLAKFFVIGAAVEDEAYVLAVVAMLAAVVAAFLYLRVIVAMYMLPEGEEAGEAPRGRVPVPLGMGVSLVVTLLFTVVVGIVPSPVVDFARDAVPVLFAAP